MQPNRNRTEATVPRFRVRAALTDHGELWRVVDTAMGRFVAAFTQQRTAVAYARIFELAEDGAEAWR